MPLSLTADDLLPLLRALHIYEQAGSPAADDNARQASLFPADDPEVVITALLTNLPAPTALQTIALALIGRGHYDPAEWEEALHAAEADIDDAGSVAQALLDLPMGGSCIESGLAAFGVQVNTGLLSEKNMPA